ncbi:solute carrier family 22 member 13-like [Eupeodes corollae]|uniref:solute carrier family 22 member 13-like n=1 Tax=Eupeodes corollae TaxID=290404 RepID=UPI0024905707|nr:solute carrier family 22 member 13-like [Eupeodes corollae]
MDFEKVLNKCGDYSRYQFLLLISFGVLNIFSAWHYFAQTIVGFTPPHWCSHESFTNLSFVDIKAIYSKFERPSCTKLIKVDAGLESYYTASEEKCTEWIYNYDFGYKSISAEMNWVCDDAHKLAVGQSLFFIGSVIGTILFGYFADRIGRLPTMIMANLSGCIGDFLSSYTSSLPEFAACRFISGMATDTCFYLMYIMVFEYIRPSKRTFGLNIIPGIFYCLGLVMIPWMAVSMGNWRNFLFLESIPIATVVFYAFFLCESAQWLITRQDYEGAVKCLKHVAKFNRRTVEESVFDEFEKYCRNTIQKCIDEKHIDDNFFGMFKTPRLRKITIILLIKSMIITISFDIVGKNMEGLGTSPFILFSTTSLVYIPAALTMICLQNRIGRKGMACFSLFMCSVFTMTIGITIVNINSFENATILALLVAVSRYGTVIAYEAEAQYAAELIPTSVRGQGVAIIHVVGYLFSFLSAYILYLGNYYRSFPSVFVSTIMLFGSFLCLFLPETVNKTLPNYLSEGEQFARHEKWYQFRVSKNKKDVAI